MSKPIKITDDMKAGMGNEIEKMVREKFGESTLFKEIIDALRKCQMSDGQFSFRKELKFEKKFEYQNDKRRVTINITPDAYAKMATIIMANSDEVGWHGTTEKISDTEFVIDNIYVYPQTVTAATVDTDDREYANWLMDLDKISEDIFPNLHFHGHSHVNMSTGPSGVDMGHRDDIVAQLGSEDYYIFMIWNKRLEWSAAVYDMKSNTLYESKDIDVVIKFADGTTAGEVVKDIGNKVTKRTYNYQGTSYQTGSGTKVYNLPNDTKKNEKVERPKSWWEEEQEKRAKGVVGNGNVPGEFPWERSHNGGYNGGYGYGGYYDYYD